MNTRLCLTFEILESLNRSRGDSWPRGKAARQRGFAEGSRRPISRICWFCIEEAKEIDEVIRGSRVAVAVFESCSLAPKRRADDEQQTPHPRDPQ